MEFINNEILECARYGEVEDLREHLKNGGNVNHMDYNNTTALHKGQIMLYVFSIDNIQF